MSVAVVVLVPFVGRMPECYSGVKYTRRPTGITFRCTFIAYGSNTSLPASLRRLCATVSTDYFTVMGLPQSNTSLPVSLRRLRETVSTDYFTVNGLAAKQHKLSGEPSQASCDRKYGLFYHK